MSTYVHRLIEVKTEEGNWKLLSWNNPLQEDSALSKFEATQMGLDFDKLPKIKKPSYYKNGEEIEYGVYNQRPIIIDNGCTFRDNYVSDFYGSSDLMIPGIPSDIDKNTKMWLDSYVYEADWNRDEDGNLKLIDEKHSCCYVTVDMLYNEIETLRTKLTEYIEKYADKKNMTEIKSMLIQSKEAKQLLDDEKQELTYIMEDIDITVNKIEALSIEAQVADKLVNNPSYIAPPNNIRLIVFLT